MGFFKKIAIAAWIVSIRFDNTEFQVLARFHAIIQSFGVFCAHAPESFNWRNHAPNALLCACTENSVYHPYTYGRAARATLHTYTYVYDQSEIS